MYTAAKTTKCRSLPEDLRRIVRSGIVITSVSKCIEELVLNSIDAGAENVYVNVNFDSYRLEIEDDGRGISKDDLEIVGSRFTTSKCNSFSDLNNLKFYGFRGETLASLIDVSSSVVIISRACENNAKNCVYRKSFNNEDGRTTLRQVEESMRYERGTLVRINNVLGLFPVRQKRINKVLQLEQIKQILQYICLINPRVSLTMVNGGDSTNILNIQAKNSVKDSFGEIFCKSSELIKYARTLIEEHHQFSSFFFTACISSELYHNNDLQFVYVNRRFICRGKIHRNLHRLISDVLCGKKKKKSEKCNTVSMEIGNPLPPESKKSPVFVINIVCPIVEYDIVLQSQKSDVEFINWETVLKGCEGLALRFKAIVQSLSKFSGKDRIVHDAFPLTQTTDADPDGIGSKITTHDVRRALHSKVAVRQDTSVTTTTNVSNANRTPLQNKTSESLGVESINVPLTTSRTIQESPMLTLVRSRPVGLSNLKRRRTNKYPIVGKKLKIAANPNPSPKLTGHIICGFNAFQGIHQGKTVLSESNKTNERNLLEEWQTSQEWANKIQTLSVSGAHTPKTCPDKVEPVSISKIIVSPDLSPISRSIWKVQSWRNHNLSLNASPNNKDLVTLIPPSSQDSNSSDHNNNVTTPKNDSIDNDFYFQTTNRVIDNTLVAMGNPDSRIQIKEECKKILLSTKVGLDTWNRIKDIRKS